MDLQDFSGEMLYFEEALFPEIDALVSEAASNYGKKTEGLLLRALSMDASNLTTLVGLYRYYYYQHRYSDALTVAHKVIAVVGKKISFPDRWQDVTLLSVSAGVLHSFCLVRLYFFALKAAGYINLRVSNFEEGKAMLNKVVDMDSEDRIGAKILLEVLDNNSAEVKPFPVKNKLEAFS